MDGARAVLLLTDVVDSTRLTEQLGDARAASLWAAHDTAARRLLAVHGGREIDKSDGFLLLFDHVDQAVAYAEAYHTALAALTPPILARAGVHEGEVQLVESSPDDIARGAKPLEVVGLAKSLAARVMTAAAGGTTLLSPTARRAHSGDACSIGWWRLKGIDDPLELFRVGTDPTPPPDAGKGWRVVRRGQGWRPARDIPHALPAERDAFVGRRADLAALAGRFDSTDRLVSVLGPGGAGKTRLALHYAWTFLADYPGGAWFCDLSEARDAGAIVAEIARALGVPLGSTPDALTPLGDALKARGRCLVVLDNFEQVVRHAREVVGPLLDRAVDAQFLVTTREVLGLPGEVTFQIRTLDVEEASELFVTRARAASERVDLSDAATIERLVELLDRLPLAIELAAARCRMMGLSDIVARMSERFRLLRTKGRVDRQATIEAALDWSWQLLSPMEQQALAQLSVFEGGFDLASVDAVVEVGDEWAEDVLASLVDKSLVRVVDDGRFDLLVLVQAFASARLEDPKAAEARHLAYFADLGHRWEPPVVETRNFAVAARRGLETRTIEAATWALFGWYVDAQYTMLTPTMLALARDLVQAAPAGSVTAARAICIEGGYLQDQGRVTESVACLEAALAVFEQADDDRGIVDASVSLGFAHFRLGQPERARAVLEPALALVRASDDPRVQQLEVGVLTNLAVSAPDSASAAEQAKQARDVARRFGSRRHEGLNLNNMGHCYLECGELELARAALEEAAPINREGGNRRSEASSMMNLARVEIESGEADIAHRYEAGIEIYEQIGATVYVAIGSAMAAVDLAAVGDLERAQAYAERACAGLTGPRKALALATLADVVAQQGDLEAARRHLGEARAEPSPPTALVGELALVGARVALAAGSAEEALQALAPLDEHMLKRRERRVRKALIESAALRHMGEADEADAVLDALAAALPADATLWQRQLASARG